MRSSASAAPTSAGVTDSRRLGDDAYWRPRPGSGSSSSSPGLARTSCSRSCSSRSSHVSGGKADDGRGGRDRGPPGAGGRPPARRPDPRDRRRRRSTPSQITERITGSEGRPDLDHVVQRTASAGARPRAPQKLEDGVYRLGFEPRRGAARRSRGRRRSSSPGSTEGDREVARQTRPREGARRSRARSASSTRVVRAARPGSGVLPLGARADQALAGAAQPAAAAAARRRPHRVLDRSRGARGRAIGARSTSASPPSGSRSCCCSSSSACRTTSAAVGLEGGYPRVADGQSSVRSASAASRSAAARPSSCSR